MNSKRTVIFFCCLMTIFRMLQAGEVPWTPGTPYNYDRRQSASEDSPSPWALIQDSSRIEYRLIYLMEADRNAKKLRQASKLPEAEGILLYSTLDDLDEVFEVCYQEAIPCFKAKPNPTLLLMMLYHYSAYVNSAMERWQPTIEALRMLDAAITEKAAKLASSSKAKKSK